MEVAKISIDDQVAAAAREVRQRERVYARWVEAGKMSAQKAAHEIAAMKAIVDTLKGLQSQNRLF